MVKQTGTTNPELKSLIQELKKLAIERKIPLYKRLAIELSKPTRQKRTVNLSRINRNSKDSETIIVPGKVLSAGNLEKKITIVAWQFSEKAIVKIDKSESKVMCLNEFIKGEVKGKKVRIIG